MLLFETKDTWKNENHCDSLYDIVVCRAVHAAQPHPPTHPQTPIPPPCSMEQSHCGHPGFSICTILACFDPEVILLLQSKFRLKVI